jgi:alkanesulfonate monooxygenase SsuD/methylene tetrahydromethanopterin reductase-like flavin-dependent oxidoreductase (luciferase family)
VAEVVPLSVLDLSPVIEGSTPRQALRNTLDLARRCESLGYRRYWVAEHHFVAGVASSSPAVLIAAIAAVTSTIRVGSGAVQLGHQTAAAVVEAFGTLSELYPGRIDLGLGRSGQKRREVIKAAEAAAATAGAGANGGAAPGTAAAPAAAAPAAPAWGPPPAEAAVPRPVAAPDSAGPRTVSGLLIPERYSPVQLYKSPRFAAQAALLQQSGAESADFGVQVGDILALLGGRYTTPSGLSVTAIPGAGADAEVWILGSSAGQSAQVAGALGLPFAANYHVSPATVLEAVAAYRSAFRPSPALAAPYVQVSADVVVAPTAAEARTLARGYPLWVRSVRSGDGAMRFPSPETVAAFPWTEEDRALVEDRVSTQFVGTPETVARQLRVLRDATGADELLVTTITYRYADRVRSHELLAREWGLS